MKPQRREDPQRKDISPLRFFASLRFHRTRNIFAVVEHSERLQCINGGTAALRIPGWDSSFRGDFMCPDSTLPSRPQQTLREATAAKFRVGAWPLGFLLSFELWILSFVPH